jgi:ADP-ribose pyrophosphatase YjhB (NUDIX family)
VRWGETTEAAAERELAKQTGLTADFSVKAFCRTMDHARQTGDLLEDKLFIVMQATEVQGEPDNTWGGGTNAWLTLDELHQKPRHYTTTRPLLDNLRAGKTYFTLTPEYTDIEY